jgi:hypothetical protein
MEKEKDNVRKEYIQISSDTRNKLTLLAGTVIASIYFFSNDENRDLLKIALILFFTTIAIEVLAGFLKSKHYSLWFDEKIKTIDYTESIYGRLADFLFWIPPIVFVAGAIVFFTGVIMI